MSITVQTTLEKLEILRAFVKTQLPNISVSNDTDLGAALQAIASAQNGLDYNVLAVEDDIYPTTASREALIRHAETKLGTAPVKSATISSGVNALRVYGTDTSTVAAGDTLAHSDGTRYQLLEAGTVGSVVTGYVDVSVESISTGEATNKGIGEVLTFETPPTGIQSDAYVIVALTGGSDEEDTESLRNRLIDAYMTPPAGGRASDYEQWATGVTGVDNAYVFCPSSGYPTGRRGLGTVDICITKAGSGSSKIPTATIIADAQDAIDTNRPALVYAANVIAPTSQAQDVDVRISCSNDYAFDWTGTMTVSSWNPATLTATITTAPASGLQTLIDAGLTARIWLNGEQLTVTTYTKSPSPNTITVSSTPTVLPASPDVIYPAGPCSQGVYDAITALIDTLGPSRTLGPSPFQSWDDTLRISRIYDVVMDIPGVVDSLVVTPASNVQPTDTGTVIYMLTPGEITVRPL